MFDIINHNIAPLILSFFYDNHEQKIHTTTIKSVR